MARHFEGLLEALELIRREAVVGGWRHFELTTLASDTDPPL